MGKGDIKTKKGKIAKGTFGVSRPRPSASNSQPAKSKDKAAKKPAKKKSTKAKASKK